MKPGFALNLTHNGINLLHRTPHGWHSIGAALLDDPELTETLAVMRRTAISLEPGGLSCKLIIPSSQILYITADATGIPAERAEELGLVVTALTGMTPYAVQELAHDWQREDDTLYIAAIARETLSEAETFACDHRFNPVCFVAMPEDPTTFNGEPYFGETSFATDILHAGDHVERDTDAILVTTPIEAELALISENLPPNDGEDGTLRNSEQSQETETAHALVSNVDSVPDMPAEILITAPIEDEKPDGDSEASLGGGALPTDLEATSDTPSEVKAELSSEATPVTEEMTVFGARITPEQAGTAKFSSRGLLILTAIAVIFGGLLALWMGQAAQRDTGAPQAAAPTEIASIAQDDNASIIQDNTEPAPQPSVPPAPIQLTYEDAEDFYAENAIWILAPDVGQYNGTETPAPKLPDAVAAGSVGADGLYLPSHDPALPSFDALALPLLNTHTSERQLPDITDPAPAGTTFAVNGIGLVIPTPEGTETANGIRIFAGRPDFLIPPRPIDAPDEETAPEDTVDLSEFHPYLRPSDLIQNHERSIYGGLTRNELAARRPDLRPQSAQNAPDVDITPTEFAVAVSVIPTSRPDGFDATVAAALAARSVARDRDSSESASPAASAPASTARPSGPVIPTRASVARQATITNAINLRRLSLIGVYKTSGTRRALMRTRSGRYVRVEVGDRIDGGRVAAIGDNSIQYIKGSRNITMEVPGS